MLSLSITNRGKLTLLTLTEPPGLGILTDLRGCMVQLMMRWLCRKGLSLKETYPLSTTLLGLSPTPPIP